MKRTEIIVWGGLILVLILMNFRQSLNLSPAAERIRDSKTRSKAGAAAAVVDRSLHESKLAAKRHQQQTPSATTPKTPPAASDDEPEAPPGEIFDRYHHRGGVVPNGGDKGGEQPGDKSWKVTTVVLEDPQRGKDSRSDKKKKAVAAATNPISTLYEHQNLPPYAIAAAPSLWGQTGGRKTGGDDYDYAEVVQKGHNAKDGATENDPNPPSNSACQSLFMGMMRTPGLQRLRMSVIWHFLSFAALHEPTSGRGGSSTPADTIAAVDFDTVGAYVALFSALDSQADVPPPSYSRAQQKHIQPSRNKKAVIIDLLSEADDEVVGPIRWLHSEAKDSCRNGDYIYSNDHSELEKLRLSSLVIGTIEGATELANDMVDSPRPAEGGDGDQKKKIAVQNFLIVVDSKGERKWDTVEEKLGVTATSSTTSTTPPSWTCVLCLHGEEGISVYAAPGVSFDLPPLLVNPHPSAVDEHRQQHEEEEEAKKNKRNHGGDNRVPGFVVRDHRGRKGEGNEDITNDEDDDGPPAATIKWVRPVSKWTPRPPEAEANRGGDEQEGGNADADLGGEETRKAVQKHIRGSVRSPWARNRALANAQQPTLPPGANDLERQRLQAHIKIARRRGDPKALQRAQSALEEYENRIKNDEEAPFTTAMQWGRPDYHEKEEHEDAAHLENQLPGKHDPELNERQQRWHKARITPRSPRGGGLGMARNNRKRNDPDELDQPGLGADDEQPAANNNFYQQNPHKQHYQQERFGDQEDKNNNAAIEVDEKKIHRNIGWDVEEGYEKKDRQARDRAREEDHGDDDGQQGNAGAAGGAGYRLKKEAAGAKSPFSNRNVRQNAMNHPNRYVQPRHDRNNHNEDKQDDDGDADGGRGGIIKDDPQIGAGRVQVNENGRPQYVKRRVNGHNNKQQEEGATDGGEEELNAKQLHQRKNLKYKRRDDGHGEQEQEEEEPAAPNNNNNKALEPDGYEDDEGPAPTSRVHMGGVGRNNRGGGGGGAVARNHQNRVGIRNRGLQMLGEYYQPPPPRHRRGTGQKHNDDEDDTTTTAQLPQNVVAKLLRNERSAMSSRSSSSNSSPASCLQAFEKCAAGGSNGGGLKCDPKSACEAQTESTQDAIASKPHVASALFDLALLKNFPAGVSLPLVAGFLNYYLKEATGGNILLAGCYASLAVPTLAVTIGDDDSSPNTRVKFFLSGVKDVGQCNLQSDLEEMNVSPLPSKLDFTPMTTSAAQRDTNNREDGGARREMIPLIDGAADSATTTSKPYTAIVTTSMFLNHMSEGGGSHGGDGDRKNEKHSVFNPKELLLLSQKSKFSGPLKSRLIVIGESFEPWRNKDLVHDSGHHEEEHDENSSSRSCFSRIASFKVGLGLTIYEIGSCPVDK